MLTIVAVVVLLLLQQTSGTSTIPLPKNLQCSSSLECFDSTSLVCSEDCQDCPSTFLQTNVECSIDQLLQGNCNELSCSSECSDNNRAVSLDQRTCTSCSSSGGTTNLYESSSYDIASSECTCNNPSKGPPTGTAIISKKLVEIYDETSGLPIRKDCFICPKGMAVITEELYEEGQNFYITAGRKYTANPYLCVSCPDQNMIFDTSYSCVCTDGYLLTGEASIGEQSCISKNPSISTPGYAKVRFQDPASLGTYDFTLESMTMSHLYTKAASECEFYKASTGKSSCQALGNLCVLTMYDENSPACKQLETISQKRLDTYHGIEEWKHTMPWLYYSDESEYTTNDKSLNMKISFQPQQNLVHELTFKLAKYTVNGTFVGIEDLQNQFEYCLNSLSQDEEIKPHWLRFGMTHRHEYSCSTGEKLLGNEMYLYDMYIVDNSLDACGGGDSESTYSFDCLYPVPVLNRNLVRDNKFPNINQQFGDDIDDQYTRRFFLFDNQSGRTTSGIEAIRYAKKIVLQIQTQRENHNQIYTPQLIIEYETTTSLSSDNKVSNTSPLLFKVEYSMKTEKFWNALMTMIIFVIALFLVIFGIRMNNWQSRQKSSTSEDPSGASSLLGFQAVLHAFMVACHIFATLFFCFIFFVCTYWFIFFRLQDEVFLLMPPKNEFYGATDEYLFFQVSFHSLFWAQTLWLVYTIALQCRADIFFIDCEPVMRRKKASMWRLLTVANEFNKMQSKRRSSIEFTLLFMGFIMIGLGQNTNALPQPTTSYHHNVGDDNIALGFANTVLFWAVAATIQYLWRYLIYERYIDEPPGQKFIDLSTVCNISTIISIESNKGFFLHCKSQFQSDCGIEEMITNLKREAQIMERGLPGAPSDCQGFDFFLSPVFRRQISKIYSYARPMNNFTSNCHDEEKWALARAELTRFLQSFIDRQPPSSRDGLVYIVREPCFTERVLNLTPADFRNTEPSCVLLPNMDGFLSSTFLGIEMDLLIHDILTYNIVSVVFNNNVGISIFLTYAMHLVRSSVRSWFGQRNLSEKSLIDSRFLR